MSGLHRRALSMGVHGIHAVELASFEQTEESQLCRTNRSWPSCLRLSGETSMLFCMVMIGGALISNQQPFPSSNVCQTKRQSKTNRTHEHTNTQTYLPARAHAHTDTQTYLPARTRAHAHAPAHTHPPMHAGMHAHSLTYSLTLALSHSRTLALSHSHSRSRTLTLTLTLALSHTHILAHTSA